MIWEQRERRATGKEDSFGKSKTPWQKLVCGRVRATFEKEHYWGKKDIGGKGGRKVADEQTRNQKWWERT